MPPKGLKGKSKSSETKAKSGEGSKKWVEDMLLMDQTKQKTPKLEETIEQLNLKNKKIKNAMIGLQFSKWNPRLLIKSQITVLMESFQNLIKRGTYTTEVSSKTAIPILQLEDSIMLLLLRFGWRRKWSIQKQDPDNMDENELKQWNEGGKKEKDALEGIMAYEGLWLYHFDKCWKCMYGKGHLMDYACIALGTLLMMHLACIQSTIFERKSIPKSGTQALPVLIMQWAVLAHPDYHVDSCNLLWDKIALILFESYPAALHMEGQILAMNIPDQLISQSELLSIFGMSLTRAVKKSKPSIPRKGKAKAKANDNDDDKGEYIDVDGESSAEKDVDGEGDNDDEQSVQDSADDEKHDVQVESREEHLAR
ncbi:hypothetical protein EDC04DRAFT_2608910 [Pisolithus marmoratus]|nr:hypothetical protein EDC04DRAFT_2608910 [Pisolithus marmoratus]